MKLFHVSEESNIKVFKPIKPYRKDMKESPPLVWALMIHVYLSRV